MHQAQVSASAKKAWEDLSDDEKARLNAEAAVDMERFKILHPNYFKNRAKRKAASSKNNQSRSKKQKTIHSSQSQQDQQQITHQVPINAMEMVQQPQSLIRIERPIQIQDDKADQVQHEQLSEADSFRGAQIHDDSTPGEQVDQMMQTPVADPSFSLDGASDSPEAQIGDNGTTKSQEQQAAQGPASELSFDLDRGLGDFP
ncbi:hypothetical protein GGR58DRAFT_499138 [Xylaria digitata]|nr:hypothetical protein GGR58DRAFT_499138 [Xylaria digitata]